MNWNLEDYTFELDDSLIAKYPPAERGDSRLMVLQRSPANIQSYPKFSALEEHLREGDLLVFNNTKVSKRRVFLQTPKGRLHECIFLEEVGDEWYCLLRNSSKVKEGNVLFDVSGHIEFTFSRREGKSFLKPSEPLSEAVFDRIGTIPIPPYLKRRADSSDEVRYQTVYAKVPGSVASPTAGLHFTDSLKEALTSKGVQMTELTLSVGYGTFAPLEESQIREKKLHRESFEISESTADLLTKSRARGKRILAVGTTTLRALESCYQPSTGLYKSGSASTEIFITPEDTIRSIDGLLTNFHLPASSILLLVAAFVGKDLLLRSYQQAIQERYRFYSYGDAMLIL
jgi:S-adenosylmethionine:tRNA ribosyltransferase-isomerase